MSELSPNASSMLRICTLTAWADLQVATRQQAYLEDVVSPHRPTLSSLWVAALRDFASLRGDTEVLQDSTLAAMEVSYSGMGREVLLPVGTFLLLVHVVQFRHICSSTTKRHGSSYCKPWPVSWPLGMCR